MGRGHHISASEQSGTHLEVRDDQLGRIRRTARGDGVFQRPPFKPEGCEDLADLRPIVDLQNEITADPGLLVGPRLEVIALKHALPVSIKLDSGGLYCTVMYNLMLLIG